MNFESIPHVNYAQELGYLLAIIDAYTLKATQGQYSCESKLTDTLLGLGIDVKPQEDAAAFIKKVEEIHKRTKTQLHHNDPDAYTYLQNWYDNVMGDLKRATDAERWQGTAKDYRTLMRSYVSMRDKIRSDMDR